MKVNPNTSNGRTLIAALEAADAGDTLVNYVKRCVEQNALIDKERLHPVGQIIFDSVMNTCVKDGYDMPYTDAALNQAIRSLDIQIMELEAARAMIGYGTKRTKKADIPQDFLKTE